MNKLERKIMRGIYYAYFLRLVSQPGILQGFVMLAVIIMLTRFVSIGNVIHNFSQMEELSNVGTFFYNAFRTTEIWTYLLGGIFIYLVLSLRITLMPRKREEYSYAQI